MKRFFSLMLVALLLVSALPFAASAASVECKVCHKTDVIPVTGTEWNKAVTCTEDGQDVYKCNNTECANFGKWFTVVVKAAGKHDFADVVETAPGCTDAGVIRPTCKVCGATANTKPIAATGHKMDKESVKTAAGCATEGVKIVACSNAGCTESYEAAIPATGNHAYVNGACKHCGVSDGIARSEVVFYNNRAQKVITETYTDKVAITVPTGELIANYEFRGWWSGENGSGTQLTSGHVWNAEKDDTTWYAWYVYNPNKDGVSTITVTARCYIDNVGNSYRDVPVLTQTLPDNTNVFDWLTANKNTTILNATYSNPNIDTDKYEWKTRYFYNYNGSEVLTSQSTFADGPKAILIKLEAKDNTTRANVQLYLHKNSTTADPFRILDMNGYTSGMNVTRDAAINLIKQYYSYKSVGNLFTENDWNSLQNGENVAGRTSVYLTDNGTYKIHVVVTNANSKSGTADSSNPKTGDYITVAVTTMVLAAAAVITLAEMKKRKMI